MGPLERAVESDLAQYPDEMRDGGVAMVARLCARVFDEGGLAPRDAAGYAREVRLALSQLRDMAPGEIRGDRTDEVRERREKRMESA